MKTMRQVLSVLPIVLGLVWLRVPAAALTPVTTATAAYADSFEPQWSPDGSKVAFSSSRDLDGTDAPNPNRTSNLWRANADGTALTPITNATAAGADSSAPRWSPDGSQVVFSSSRNLDGTDAPNANRTFNIWRVNADGTGLTPITYATAAGAGSFAPQWSPDGSQVVFSSSRKLDGTDAPNPNFTSNIWRVNADGSGLTPITTATAAYADSFEPRWSPDGSKVVFSSSRKLDGTDATNPNFTLNIWRANADGTGLTPLTRVTALGAGSFGPQWSPDSSQVVFHSSRAVFGPDGVDAANPNFTSNIWRVNADATGLIAITYNIADGADNFAPQWSPDGSWFVFSSRSTVLDASDAPNPNRTSNIWRTRADGMVFTPLTRATALGADSLEPQWSPDGSNVVFRSSRKLDGTDAPNPNGTNNIWRVP